MSATSKGLKVREKSKQLTTALSGGKKKKIKKELSAIYFFIIQTFILP